MTVRVSVIVPTYQRPAWCEEAVKSVLGQEGVDLEVIVVLDGEQSETAQTLAALSDARVRVIPAPHGGQSAAQNRGLAAAEGEFVAFLDDDDALLPGGIAARVAALDRHAEAVAVFGLPAVMDSEGREIRGSRDAASRGRETCRPRLTEILRGKSVFPSTALVRRPAAEKAGGFDADLWTGQDWAFFLRLAAVGPFVFLPGATALRRRHAGQFRANSGEQEAGIERWAARYFDDPKTPAEAKRYRTSLLGLHYNWIARNYRRAGDLVSYRRCFHRAVRLRPSLLLHPRRLLRYLGSMIRAGSSASVAGGKGC